MYLRVRGSIRRFGGDFDQKCLLQEAKPVKTPEQSEFGRLNSRELTVVDDNSFE
jgi:hypothetical protein